MVRGESVGPDPAWCSASELAEYAFCPRALHYRHHPPAGGIAPASARSRDAGRRYHVRRSASVRSRDDHAGAWAAALAVAVAALALAVYLGWLA